MSPNTDPPPRGAAGSQQPGSKGTCCVSDSSLVGGPGWARGEEEVPSGLDPAPAGPRPGRHTQEVLWKRVQGLAPELCKLRRRDAQTARGEERPWAATAPGQPSTLRSAGSRPPGRRGRLYLNKEAVSRATAVPRPGQRWTVAVFPLDRVPSSCQVPFSETLIKATAFRGGRGWLLTVASPG